MRPEHSEEFSEAETLFAKDDKAGALAGYLKLAEKECEEGQFMAGWCYARGLGTPKNLDRAIDYFQVVAERGDPKAQWYLGRVHGENGASEAARAWYEKSADQGFDPSCCRIAHLHYHGVGVPQDRGKAIELFRIGAESGHLTCQAMYAGRLIRGYKGLRGIANGLRLMAATFIEISRIAGRNPEDLRLVY